MALQNLMEDVVGSIVDSIFSNDQDAASLGLNRDDVVAFVLNRVQPRYITSERGLLHGNLEAQQQTQQKLDIIMVCYDAIKTIKSRRPSASMADKSLRKDTYYSIRHIMGKVSDAETIEPLFNVKVSLLWNGAPADMFDLSWANPYTTREATHGYYHFWPVYIEGKMGGLAKVLFTLRFEHPDFQTKDIDVEIGVDPSSHPCATEFISGVCLQKNNKK